MAEKEHASRFHTKRIAYALQTKIIPYTAPTGEPAYGVKTDATGDLSPTSSLGWTDTKIFGRFTIPGNAQLTTQNGAITFTSETGASVTRYADGSMIFAASADSPVSERERLRRTQAGFAWWEKDRDAIENEYVYATGSVVAAPEFGQTKQHGVPYLHFPLLVAISDTEARAFDVYGYGQTIALVNRRNLKPDDLVTVRASVQFHDQRLPGGRMVAVRWLRLFNVEKK